MSVPPLVSVIIPVHNAEPWIAETIDSVLNQTYTNIEVVIVDDGSNDASLSIVRQYERDGVTVITQENSGACAARNRGLSEAKGDYIQYIDADDLLSPDKIERQVNLLEASPPGRLAVCGVIYFDDGTDPGNGLSSPGYPALNSDDPLQWLLDLWTPGPGYGTTRWGMVPYHSWLISRDVAERAGVWDAHITQDQDGEYFTRVLLASAGVRWEPEGRVYYHKFTKGTSVSGGTSESHLRGRLRAVDSKVRHVMPRTTEGNKRHASAALARQYLDVAYHAYPQFPDLVVEAETKVAELGGYDGSFFKNTRLKHVERLAGWKIAKRISHAYRSCLRQPL